MTITTPTTRGLRLLLATLALVAITSCGSGDDHPVTADELWVRPTAPGAEAAAIYGTLTNTSDDAVELTDGYVPACGRLELHEVDMVDDVMQMRPATADVAMIEPGDSLVLEPMGLHLMCLDLASPFVEGEESGIEFTFEPVGVLETTFAVDDR